MRKTTTYARKQRRLGPTYNCAEYLNAIERSRAYAEPGLPAVGVLGTEPTAVKALVIVKTALEALTTGATPPANEEHFDLMAHAVGVSIMRAGQIGGDDPQSNELLPPLIEGNTVLRQVLARRRKWRKWEVLPAEAQTLAYAVEVYETILMASSPAQMAQAVDMRMRALQGRVQEGIEA
jgi:hypothetical protein